MSNCDGALTVESKKYGSNITLIKQRKKTKWGKKQTIVNISNIPQQSLKSQNLQFHLITQKKDILKKKTT